MGFILGVVGTAQQLETANASGGGGSAPSTQGTAPNPTGVAISSTSNSATNFVMGAQEVSNAQNASNPDGADQFDVIAHPSQWSNGQNDTTIDVSTGGQGDLNAAYSGQSASAIIAFLGYIQATNATSFQWSLSVSSSLSAGSTHVSYTSGTAASTDRDATTYSATLGQKKGIEAFCHITWGGGRGGFIFPSNGDTVTCTIGADATNSNGTTSASDLVIKYTFST